MSWFGIIFETPFLRFTGQTDRHYFSKIIFDYMYCCFNVQSQMVLDDFYRFWKMAPLSYSSGGCRPRWGATICVFMNAIIVIITVIRNNIMQGFPCTMLNSSDHGLCRLATISCHSKELSGISLKCDKNRPTVVTYMNRLDI